MPSSTIWTTLFVTIQISPEHKQEFLEGLKISYDGVAAEPECIFYDLFEDSENPGVFKIVEIWTKDRGWMDKVGFIEFNIPLSASLATQQETFESTSTASGLSYKLLMKGCTQVQLLKSYYGPYLEKTRKLWIRDRGYFYTHMWLLPVE